MSFTLTTPLSFEADNLNDAAKKMGLIIYNMNFKPINFFTLEFEGQRYEVRFRAIKKNTHSPPTISSTINIKLLE